MQKRLMSIALVVPLAFALAGPTHAAREDGLHVAYRGPVARGIEHLRVIGEGPDLVANVARIAAGAPVELRVVSSFDRIGGRSPRLERTSSICARVECLVAINADFQRQEVPVGAVAVDGELLHSPNRKHHNLMVTRTGKLRAGPMSWRGRIVATDLTSLRLKGLNKARDADKLVLYTGAYGRSTFTNDHGVEMRLRFVAPRSGRVPIGATAVVRVLSYAHGKGNSKIPRRGAVLSAHGTAARKLGALWKRIQAGEAGRELLLRVETDPQVVTAVGGTPVLLRDGKVWFTDADNAFVRGRNPRTLVGWNRRGDTWLVTLDGRQSGYSDGATLAEAARFLLSLGATDGINLDGGGSSTFVLGSRGVVNRPSDRAFVSGGRSSIVTAVGPGVDAGHVERPVTNALVVVPKAGEPLGPIAPPDLSGAVPQVRPLALPVPAEADPASNPTAALPAVVAYSPPAAGRSALSSAAAVLLLVLIGAHARQRGWRPRLRSEPDL